MLNSAYQTNPAGCQDALLDDRTATGRQRPWREKRLRTELVAKGWKLAGEPDKARRCQDCGTWLTFGECPGDGTKYLVQANFCKQRLCPLCAWRRSMKLSAEISAVLHLAAERWPERAWVMLTLTQRNVPGEDLAHEVSRILDGWGKLRHRREFREVSGWLRTLEVTYNAKAGTWHPHLHVLLQVTPSYFTGRGYVSHAKWVAAWRAVLDLDYDPSVEVHRVRKRGSGDVLGAAAAEVGKYTVKDSDMAGNTPQEASERLLVLDSALAGRRLVAWGGGLRKLAKELESEAGDDDDLVHITGEDHGRACPVCGSELIEAIYGWSRARQAYLHAPDRERDHAVALALCAAPRGRGRGEGVSGVVSEGVLTDTPAELGERHRSPGQGGCAPEPWHLRCIGASPETTTRAPRGRRTPTTTHRPPLTHRPRGTAQG